MIYFATLIRVNDGLALCASTDLDTTFEMKESKKRLKLLSKKVGQLPARCTSKIGTYSLHFTRTGSLCTMMICSSQYPEILAFSFLTDLQREFLQQYKNEDIQKAKRPYTFVEFDMFIQRMKQRYSNTSSLTSRINVNDISEDLKQNPPYEINNSELYQHNGSTMTSYKNSGKVKIVLPLNWLGYLSGALCCVCALLNILRFVPLFAYYGAENEDHSVTAALAFLVGALLNVLLFYLLLSPLKFVPYTVATLLFATVYYLLNYRNIFQILFHVLVTLLTLYQIRQRQVTIKPPDYNV